MIFAVLPLGFAIAAAVCLVLAICLASCQRSDTGTTVGAAMGLLAVAVMCFVAASAPYPEAVQVAVTDLPLHFWWDGDEWHCGAFDGPCTLIVLDEQG